MLVALGGAVGCRDDGTVTIRGDVADLDSLGFLGDSLFARADAPLRMMDSLRAADSLRAVTGTQRNRASRARPDSGALPTRRPNVTALSPRAQAEADSMATALRLASSAASGRSRGDTVRGIVTLVGEEPARQVVLRTNNGATTITLSGMATTGLARLAGAELMVRGVKITPHDVVVAAFVVRAMHGVPALDGRLEGGAAEGWWLELSDGTGRKRLAALPAPLQELEGSRVWIATGTGTTPARQYGVIGRR